MNVAGFSWRRICPPRTHSDLSEKERLQPPTPTECPFLKVRYRMLATRLMTRAKMNAPNRYEIRA